jgi:hypothetical protein
VFYVYKKVVTHLDMEETGDRCNTTEAEIDFGACLQTAAENKMNCSIPKWGDEGIVTLVLSTCCHRLPDLYLLNVFQAKSKPLEVNPNTLNAQELRDLLTAHT